MRKVYGRRVKGNEDTGGIKERKTGVRELFQREGELGKEGGEGRGQGEKNRTHSKP